MPYDVLVRVRRCADHCDGRGVGEKLSSAPDQTDSSAAIRLILINRAHPSPVAVAAVVASRAPRRAISSSRNASIWTGDAAAARRERRRDHRRSHRRCRQFARDRALARRRDDRHRCGRAAAASRLQRCPRPLRRRRTALDNVDLKDAATPAEFARRIAERAKTKPGEWILGGDWDDQRVDAGRAPDPAADRRRHQRHAGVRQPLRRPHGARELRRARPRRHHREDAGSAGRRHRPRRERLSDRRAQGRRDGATSRASSRR